MPMLARLFGILFSVVQTMCEFRQKWVGMQFGRFFHKLIWSPCLRGQLSIKSSSLYTYMYVYIYAYIYVYIYVDSSENFNIDELTVSPLYTKTHLSCLTLRCRHCYTDEIYVLCRYVNIGIHLHWIPPLLSTEKRSFCYIFQQRESLILFQFRQEQAWIGG
jgi:hypothetical protein